MKSINEPRIIKNEQLSDCLMYLAGFRSVYKAPLFTRFAIAASNMMCGIVRYKDFLKCSFNTDLLFIPLLCKIFSSKSKCYIKKQAAALCLNFDEIVYLAVRVREGGIKKSCDGCISCTEFMWVILYFCLECVTQINII